MTGAAGLVLAFACVALVCAVVCAAVLRAGLKELERTLDAADRLLEARRLPSRWEGTD